MNPVDRDEYAAELIGGELAADRLEYLRALPGYRILDTLRLQIADLIQSRRCADKMPADRCQAAVESFLKERGAEYGTWAHYPWARRVVRVLPEADFGELRTDRNRHKITWAEQMCLTRKKVGVVGLSVGQAVALTLALERNCGELRLADFDAIDLSNLNRLRCGVHDIGVPKTWVAARQIAELDPYLDVVCFNEGYTQESADAFLDGLDVVVDECDSLDVKLQLREAARARGIPVLMNTSDRGMTDIERFDLEPARPLFHGRLKDARAEALAGLTTEEKVPIVLDIIGLSTSSVRLRASMLEIEQSIKTWPQLASDVVLGGAIVCDAARRILLGESVASGRYYVDLSAIGAQPAPAAPEPSLSPTTAAYTAMDRRRNFSDPIDRILADATLAPSAGNAQPWLWTKTEDGLALRHRRDGHASVLDYEHKAATVGLGATLESAIISARVHGYRADATLDANGDIVALVSLSRRDSTDCDGGDDHEDRSLHACLTRRRSVRTRPRTVSVLQDGVLASLTAQAARFSGLNLTYLTDRHRIEAMAGLAGEVERLRMLDPAAHADLLREVAWSADEHRRTGEGLPIESLSLSVAEEAGFQILRDPEVVAKLGAWNLGGGLAKLSRELISSSSAIGLLWSDTDTHRDYLTGGRALQRMWLEATRAEVGLCPVVTICYLLSAWRADRPLTKLQEAALPSIDRRFRALFDLPENRGDIALFRLLPAADELNAPHRTWRRSLHSIAEDGGAELCG